MLALLVQPAPGHPTGGGRRVRRQLAQDALGDCGQQAGNGPQPEVVCGHADRRTQTGRRNCSEQLQDTPDISRKVLLFKCPLFIVKLLVSPL